MNIQNKGEKELNFQEYYKKIDEYILDHVLFQTQRFKLKYDKFIED